MNRIYFLLLFGVTACAQRPLALQVQPVDLAGIYQFSSSSSYSAIVKIEKGGKYNFSSVTCTGLAEGESGQYRLSGQWMELSNPFRFCDGTQVSRLKIVEENKDHFLIPESMVEFLGRNFPTPAAGFVRGGYERRLAIELESRLVAIPNR